MSALLEVDGVRAGYGSSTVLDGLHFSMGAEAVCIVGRNGMGKTTLCHSLLGLLPITSGAIRFKGLDIAGLPPERIARHGVALVPQGRRLFPSLTVDEHLAMLAKASQGKVWSRERVYELFPRLADRMNAGAGYLSGGEQQMLAVGRALMLNGDLVVMDEPSEGLAPTIVDILVGAIHRLVTEGTAVLVVEQNLRAAADIGGRQLIMVSGRIQLETTADALRDDVELQHRHLGL